MTQRSLTFYANPQSRARLTRWMLEETGLPYDTVALEFGAAMKSPDFLAINPMGKVPAIRHGDTVVTENAAICLYLADLVPDLRLAPPAGSAARGPYYRWMLFMAGPLESMLTAQATGHLAPAIGAGYGEPGQVLDVLEAALQQALDGNGHLAGDSFTAADLYAAALLAYYMQTQVVAPRPAFEAFAKRHLARPAQARAFALDNALMPPPGKA